MAHAESRLGWGGAVLPLRGPPCLTLAATSCPLHTPPSSGFRCFLEDFHLHVPKDTWPGASVSFPHASVRRCFLCKSSLVRGSDFAGLGRAAAPSGCWRDLRKAGVYPSPSEGGLRQGSRLVLVPASGPALCLRLVAHPGSSEAGWAGRVFLGIGPLRPVAEGHRLFACPSRPFAVCRVCGDPCFVPVLEVCHFSLVSLSVLPEVCRRY